MMDRNLDESSTGQDHHRRNDLKGDENNLEDRYPNIDDAISMITFNSLNTHMRNVIGVPLDNMPSLMAGEDGGCPMNESSSFNTNAAVVSKKSPSEMEANKSASPAEKYEEKFEKDDTCLVDPPYTCFNGRQIFVVFSIIIFVGFLGPMAGNIYIPALPLLQREFNVSATIINSTVSVFMAVFSVGPLFWGFYADLTGRKFLYVISLSILVVVNVLLATVPSNIAALFVLRVLQAFGSSSAISLGTGTVTDIVSPRHRGKAIAYFMMGPNMGPIFAPIVAGLVLMKGAHWRWLFGFTSIMSGIGLFLVVTILPETLRCIVGNSDPAWEENNDKPAQVPSIEFCKDLGIQKPRNNTPQFLKLYPKPPKPTVKTYWKMLRFPPLVVVSISSAMLFSNYYALSVTFSHFLQNEYNFSMLSVGIAYVCPGVSMLLGSQVGGHLSDYLRQRWINHHKNATFPLECRLYVQIWGILINTIGCIGYGWSVQYHRNVVLVFMFSAFNAFGLTWVSNTTMTYLTELMPKRVSGTIAISSFLRNIGATVSSAVIIKLCQEMGTGWCFSGLGFCNILSFLAIGYIIHRQRKGRLATTGFPLFDNM